MERSSFTCELFKEKPSTSWRLRTHARDYRGGRALGCSQPQEDARKDETVEIQEEVSISDKR
jgi:hypothetical protein